MEIYSATYQLKENNIRKSNILLKNIFYLPSKFCMQNRMWNYNFATFSKSTNKGGSRRRKKVVSARFWNFLWLCFVWLIAFFLLRASFWFVPLSTCVSLFETEASNPHPHPNPNPHTQASRPLVFPLFHSDGQTDQQTNGWTDRQSLS